MAARQRLKKLYILPTQHGLFFLAVNLIMILVGAASGNNLVYSLAFVLFAVYLIAMVATHSNLKGVEVELQTSEDGFAGEASTIRLVIHNPSARGRFLIRGRIRVKKSLGEEVVGELAPGTQMSLPVNLLLTRRGKYQVQAFELSTVYPLGLFRAWGRCPVKAEFFVYPSRIAGIGLTPAGDSSGLGARIGRWRETQHEDFREHTRYQPGESQHQIDWKAFARRGELLSKRFESTGPRHFVVDWESVRHLPREQALSQLASWIEELRQGPDSFEVWLPDRRVGSGRGLQHGRDCLRLLAEFPEEAA